MDAVQDHFHSFLQILAVEEKTADVPGPERKEGNISQLLLGYITGGPGGMDIGEDDVENTSVVAYIEDRSVSGNPFFSDDGQLYSGSGDQ